MTPTEQPPHAGKEVIREAWLRGLLGYKLAAPKFAAQREIHAWWQTTAGTMAVLHAARGFGKTSLELIIGAELCLRKKRQRVVFAAPTREQAKSIVIPVSQIVYGDAPKDIAPVWQELNHCYFFPSTESRIIIDGADDERGNHLRGPFAHLVFADEAGFWRHCHYVVKSVLLPQVQRVGGRILVSSTSPESVGHEFVGLIAEAKQRGTYLARTIRQNTMLSKEQQDQTIDELGGPTSTTVLRECFCELVTEKERAVVPEYDVALNVAEVEKPAKSHKYVAMDLGLIDFTHILFGYYDFLLATIVIEDEHMATYETTEQLAAAVRTKEKQLWGDEKPHRRVADNDAQQLHDLNVTHKLHFAPATKTDSEAALNRMRELIKLGRIKIHPRCIQLCHQLKVGIWNNARTDYERLPGAGHLDGIDALKYLVRHIDYQSNPFATAPWKPSDIAEETMHAYAHKTVEHAIKGIMPKGLR